MNKEIFNHVSVVICSYYSAEKLKELILNIDQNYKILIIDNAKEECLKNFILSNYPYINYFAPNNDHGLSWSYNYALAKLKTKYIFITQPDVILNKDTIPKLYEAAEKYPNASMLSSIEYNNDQKNLDLKFLKFGKNNKILNYNFNKNFIKKSSGDFCVDAINCTTMLINVAHVKKINGWDNNYFMYCEDIDLSIRARIKGYEIIKVNTSIVNHIGFGSHNKSYDSVFEKKRNWHWAWSQIYFYKKHQSSLYLLRIYIKLILVSLFKFFLYSLLFSGKRKIYFYRFYGGICSAFNLESFYRNKITK
jgi:N-acetylglucosaminyl-diphospho-decaprenol L-rhamnosyltransferase